MFAVFFRTVIVYLVLVVTMRFMGKRQLGELELPELVTTLLLSEVAALPLTDRNIPVLYAVIPIVTLVSLEMFTSVLLIKFPALKNILSPRPNVLINKGELRQSELKRLRISNDEFISELRRNGYPDINQVYYAIVEENGKLTVIPRGAFGQPTAAQLGMTVKESGIPHILVSDGRMDPHGLETVGVTQSEVFSYIASSGVSLDEIFLLLRDDGGKYTIILKDSKK